MTWKKLYNILCDASHIMLGVIVAMAWMLHWSLSMIGAFLFVVYELSEAKKVNDLAYQDIKEFCWGFFTILIILIIWKFLW